MNDVRKYLTRKFGVLCLLLSMPFAADAQKFQLGTNAVGLACLGTLNAEFSYGCARHWSVGVSGKYNPFTFGQDENQMQMKQRSVAANAKWWPWHVYSGWWVGGLAQWQEYNVGGIVSAETEEGQKFGGGVMAGYSYMLSSHLNLDFGLGIWGGVKRYVVYECPKCGRTVDSGTKAFILPSDVLISICYVF